MKNLRTTILQGVAWVALGALILGGCSKSSDDSGGDSGANSSAKSGGKAKGTAVTIPAGTVIHAVLDQALSSNGSSAGQEFTATVSEPVLAEGKVAIAKDARAKGQVLVATPSGRLKTPAEISFKLTSVEVGGVDQQISTSAVALRQKSHKKRDIEFIGGGGALGALIGGLAGGGKGAAIGAAAGAGAGTGGAALTGKKDITVPAEAPVSFKLESPVTANIK
ncbi:MAG: hypothetical protein ACRD50_16085 [Candidatus Acidiferrales bacterium]